MCLPKLTGWIRRTLVREAAKKSIASLEQLKRFTGQVGESYFFFLDDIRAHHKSGPEWQEESHLKSRSQFAIISVDLSDMWKRTPWK